MSVNSPASNAVAPTVPSLVYIAPANSGNTAANDERRALFAAIADAAMGRYAVTRYVNTPVKMKYTPAPKGMEPMMGPIQCTCLYVVKARMKRPVDGGGCGQCRGLDSKVRVRVGGIRTQWSDDGADFGDDEAHLGGRVALELDHLACEQSVSTCIRRDMRHETGKGDAPIPVWLGAEGSKHAEADAQERQTRLLDAEAMYVYEDDRECLEGKVKNAQDQRRPAIR